MSGAGVTAIVPVWNGRRLLEQLLASLRAQTRPLAEIIVVDNGSRDGSAEAGEQFGARVIRMGSNAGFARAVNSGIRETRTELVAILNNDVEAAPDWLARLAAALDDPAAWFAAGKIFQAAAPGRLDGGFDALSRGGCAWRVGHGRPDGPEFSTARRIFFAPGTAALFRAELFRQLGPLEESFESYLEDVEFGLRCARAGMSGRYVPEAVAWHRGSATLGPWHPATVRRIARNQLLLVARHYPARLLVRYSWPILVAQGLWGLVALRHGAGCAWLRGKLAGVRAFGFVPRKFDRADFRSLIEILEQGDREIRAIQAKTGFDPYWRWYFRLTRGGAN